MMVATFRGTKIVVDDSSRAVLSLASESTSMIFRFAIPMLMLSGCVNSFDSRGQAPARARVVVFSNVNVVPMDTERIIESQTVVIRDGVIAEVGPRGSVDVPAGSEQIDGRGRYLFPGLTDFHIHLRSTNELLSYLAHGVTSVVHLSGASGSAPDLLSYRDDLANGERIGPTLFLAGPILDGSPPIFGAVSTVVTTPEEGRRAVDDQAAAGYDFIKVYNNLRVEVLEAVVATAHAHGKAVVGHIPRIGGRETALQRSLAAGQDMIAHGEEYFFTYFHTNVEASLDRGEIPYIDEDKIPEAVAMTLEAGVAVTPNLSFIAMTRRQLDDLDGVFAQPESRFQPSHVRAMWESQNPTGRQNLERFDRREHAKLTFVRQLTKAFADAGVPILLGTDSSAPGMYPGASAHLELSELVAAGLSNFDALATGTRNAGAFIGGHVAGAAALGTVRSGSRADLLLLRGNPIDDIANTAAIDGVMVRGRWFPKVELDRMREDQRGR